MKKILLSLLVFTSFLAFSQGIKVISNEEIPISNSEGYYNPVLSPTGDYLIVTKSDLKGIEKYDLLTGKLTTLSTDAGAGFDVQISSDGSTVVFRDKKYKDRLRYTTLKSIDINTGKVTELIKETRNLEGVSMVEGTVMAVDNGKMKTKKVSGERLSSIPAVTSIKQGQLYLTEKNTTKQFSPFGSDVNYLWSSVSPDGEKVLFYVIEHGKAYVSRLDGTNPVSLGTLRAPKWMGNDWVVGMLDRDNGEIITSSKIVAIAANGTARTELTDDSVIATNPTGSADASKIVYNTEDGKVYLMHIETTK